MSEYYVPVASLALSFMVLASMPASAADTTDTAPFRVMSYNMRYDAQSDTAARDWSVRREKVARMIQFHTPDVVGTQEGMLHQLMDLEDRLPGYEWIGVGRQSGGGEFSALFYRTDRVMLLDHDTFWLSETPNEPASKSWNAALPRIATWARFRNRVSGDTVFVLNTHFDHASAEARVKSARLITETLAGLSGNDPVIVTGDMNDPPGSKTYQTFTRGGENAPPVPLRDAKVVSQTPHYGPESTFNDFLPSVERDERIDYIFVGPDIRVRRHGHLNAKWDGQYPSDHLPVLTDVELP